VERKFRITVDGRSYNVTVEDLDEGLLAQAPAAPTSAPAPRPLPQAMPITAPAAASTHGPGDIICTLGGVVESIGVSVGQAVRAGETVLVVEAMKMKTPMIAHRDGRVARIPVKVGETVETGQLLVSLA
jgi:biotin carboxyl carrier protein